MRQLTIYCFTCIEKFDVLCKIQTEVGIPATLRNKYNLFNLI